MAVVNIANFEKKASTFQSPEQMAKLLETSRSGIPKESFFNDPTLQPLKDAWIALVFGLGYQSHFDLPCKIRLCLPDRFPDFQLKLDPETFEFEATMVLAPGRRMGADYRGDRSTGPVIKTRSGRLPPIDLRTIEEAVARKARKMYGQSVHLAVYLNTKGEAVHFSDLQKIAQGHYGQNFESIWFLSQHHLCCAKPSSNLRSQDFRPRGNWQPDVRKQALEDAVPVGRGCPSIQQA
jgi:hypothetical protein